jgi:hypothetical protein
MVDCRCQPIRLFLVSVCCCVISAADSLGGFVLLSECGAQAWAECSNVGSLVNDPKGLCVEIFIWFVDIAVPAAYPIVARNVSFETKRFVSKRV